MIFKSFQRMNEKFHEMNMKLDKINPNQKSSIQEKEKFNK